MNHGLHHVLMVLERKGGQVRLSPESSDTSLQQMALLILVSQGRDSSGVTTTWAERESRRGLTGPSPRLGGYNSFRTTMCATFPALPRTTTHPS